MNRVKTFYDIYPKRKIYESRDTQDIQIILPIAHEAKIGFINEFLGCYIERFDSWSRRSVKVGMNDKIHFWDEYCNVRLKTLQAISFHSTKEMDACVRKLLNRVNLLKVNEILIGISDSFCFDEKEKDEKEYVIWGTGAVGRMVSALLLRNKLKVRCFIDNNMQNQGNIITGIPVMPPAYLHGIDNKYLLIALQSKNIHEQEIEKQILSMGLKKEDFSYYLDFLWRRLRKKIDDLIIA